MPNELNSVEDIDAMLDQEFNINSDEDVTDDVEDTEANEENSNDTPNGDSEENDGQQVTEDQNNENDTDNNDNSDGSKLNLDDKKNFAFSQLRKENSDLKNRISASSKNEEFLKGLAAQYGYDSIESFQKAYEDARIAKEAKDKGYDPELYRQLQESNRRIAQLEEQNRQNILRERASNFKSAVDRTINEYKLGEDGRNEIFTRLENAGYSIDDILRIANPEPLIKGIMMDKIINLSKQEQIEKVKDLEDNLSDEKFDNQASEKTFSLDDLISKEMKEYKEQNFL